MIIICYCWAITYNEGNRNVPFQRPGQSSLRGNDYTCEWASEDPDKLDLTKLGKAYITHKHQQVEEPKNTKTLRRNVIMFLKKKSIKLRKNSCQNFTKGWKDMHKVK